MGSGRRGLLKWVAMSIQNLCRRFDSTLLIATLAVSSAALMLHAQTPPPQKQLPPVPDWALPGSATHQQVAPPADFHRPSTNFEVPIGVFDGQSDIGSALVPGSASFDAATGQYTINSAGYNVWYTRDEFRFLWK